jgi:hypothetical protein
VSLRKTNFETAFFVVLLHCYCYYTDLFAKFNIVKEGKLKEKPACVVVVGK